MFFLTWMVVGFPERVKVAVISLCFWLASRQSAAFKWGFGANDGLEKYVQHWNDSPNLGGL